MPARELALDSTLSVGCFGRDHRLIFSVQGYLLIVKGFSIVLRCPKDTSLRWAFQIFTAIINFTLYVYGTVVLASMTLTPAADAIRAMVVLPASARFGRLVGYWLIRPSRKGRQIVVIDIPPDCLSDFASSILEQF